MRKRLAAASCIVLLFSCLCFLSTPDPLSAEEKGLSRAARPKPSYAIGIIPFYAPEKIWQLYSPFVGYLKRATGLPWELKLYHDHNSIINAICDGEVSIAMLGPTALGRAYEKCMVRPLVVSLGKNGKPYYRSVIVTNDPDIDSLAGLKGKKFAFLEGSTAAYVLPRKMLEEEGITLDLIRPVFLGGQDRIMAALLKNEVTAGGIKESLLDRFRGERLKVLKISEPLPNFAFCGMLTSDPKAEKKFVQVLLKLNPLSNPGDRALVRKWDDEVKNGFGLPPQTYLQDVLRLHAVSRRYGL